MRTIGLIVFCILCGPTAPVLFFDAGLDLAGQLTSWQGVTTITGYSREHHWLAWTILGALQLGVLGLAAHFFWPLKWGG